MSVGDDGGLQDGGEAGLDLALVQRDWRRLGDRLDDLDADLAQLDAARRLGAAATRPLTAMTLSTPAPVARIGSSSASCSTTAWTTPQPSRTTRKLTPPRRRSECSQPATRTVSPMWLATSGVRMRLEERW